MSPKLYLSKIKWLDMKINHRLEELSEYKSKLSFISAIVYDKEIVQTSKTGSDIPDGVSKLIDMEKELNKMIDMYVDTTRRIIRQIEGLDNPVYSEILFNRYVKYMSLQDIANVMNYSYDHVKHAHGIALLKFADKYLNDNTQ